MSDKPTVFVVDDDPAMRDSLRQLVASTGFDVQCFGSAEDFLRQADRSSPGCLVLDLRMPGLDGFQVCSNLKDDPNTSHIKVLAITGYYSAFDAQKIKECGAEYCLSKPLNLSELKDWIIKLLEQRQE